MPSNSLQRTAFLLISLAGSMLTLHVSADGGVRYHDATVEVGITYARAPSLRNEIWEAIKAKANLQIPDDVFAKPVKARGIPGIAVFDFDGDGDLDVYVANGPGKANSLFSNQRMESGALTFIEVAATAGVAAELQDSSGVCYGDIDNDGDHDLLVLGTGEPNLLFENNGDGTFTDITATSGLAGGNRWSSSAAMGDVNGDGLLDIFVGNAGDLTSNAIIFVEPFALNEHNQLFLNTGNNQFTDVSETSGITHLAGLGDQAAGAGGITWAVALIDFDMDGDLDIFNADDQGAFPPKERGGFDRGIMHIFRNDGTGHFTDIAVEAGVNHSGGYMGLAFGDYDHNGALDFFVTNLGSYNTSVLDPDFNNLLNASKWFLGAGAGAFTYPGLETINATPFGWGAASLDYDNDGDTDIIFHGGIDFGDLIMLSNPGTMLVNDGSGRFGYDAEAFSESTNHIRRVVQGLAVGDLDGNGFVDILTTSGFDVAADAPVSIWEPRNGPLDGVASYILAIVPGEVFGSQVYDPALPPFPDGTLSVEMNDGANGNNWISFKLMGAMGVTSSGVVNRDAIGAIVIFTPEGGQPVMKPILGGSSFASQNALEAHFGMGDATHGQVDVLWPGGVRTRLMDVKAGERLVIPELPLSFTDADVPFFEYFKASDGALTELRNKGFLTRTEANRIKHAAIKSFIAHRYGL